MQSSCKNCFLSLNTFYRPLSTIAAAVRTKSSSDALLMVCFEIVQGSGAVAGWCQYNDKISNLFMIKRSIYLCISQNLISLLVESVTSRSQIDIRMFKDSNDWPVLIDVAFTIL